MTTLNKKPVINEEAKETAKKIRQALKANFPGVKFSVTTQVYTGGSSVNVSWTDLPLRDEVEAVVNKFKSGSFNGMEDIYEYGAYEYQGKLYSGAKYLFCRRELSPEYKEQIKNYMKENYANIDENDYYYYSRFNEAEVKMIEEMKTPAQVEEVTTVQNELNETVEIEETAANGEISFEVGTGAKGNGIEITFTSKPSEEVRNEMKKAGYRWGGKSRASIWWAINTKESLALAERLASVGAENDNNSTEAETLEVLETTQDVIALIELAEKDQILVTDSKLIGRKVFGQWGCMAGFDYGIIIGETIYNEVIVKWEDLGYQEYIELKNLVIVNDNTSLDPVGVYLMPMEEAKQPEAVTIETEQPEQPQNIHNNPPAKVLDFTSKFKQKQEQKELEEAKDHFLTNVLPYMTEDDRIKLIEASRDKEKFNSIMNELMLKTAFLRASDDMAEQYK